MKAFFRISAFILAALTLCAMCGCSKSYPIRKGHTPMVLYFYDEPVGLEEAKDETDSNSWGKGLTSAQRNKLRRFIDSVSEWSEVNAEEREKLAITCRMEIMENPVSRFYFTDDGRIYFEESPVQHYCGVLSEAGRKFLSGLN